VATHWGVQLFSADLLQAVLLHISLRPRRTRSGRGFRISGIAIALT
jgi:hypothetical protein